MSLLYMYANILLCNKGSIVLHVQYGFPSCSPNFVRKVVVKVTQGKWVNGVMWSIAHLLIHVLLNITSYVSTDLLDLLD